jgi:hypothetical protein
LLPQTECGLFSKKETSRYCHSINPAASIARITGDAALANAKVHTTFAFKKTSSSVETNW